MHMHILCDVLQTLAFSFSLSLCWIGYKFSLVSSFSPAIRQAGTWHHP